MFRFKLYILLFLTTSIKCVILKQLSNCKISFSFINNTFSNKFSLYNKNFHNNYNYEEYQFNNNKNKYTLNNNFVLYARKAKQNNKEPKSVKNIARRTKKKAELAPESEPIQESELDINTDLENDSDLNLDENPDDLQYFVDNQDHKDNELSFSKRMIVSVSSLTSSLYTPDLYDIIPILYNIKDDVLNIIENVDVISKQNAKVSDKKNKITGLFMDNDDGRIDRLILSIPSTILDRLSQSSKYGPKVESTESPLQVISLGPGFFSKIYQMAVFPYLSELSERAFGTQIDHSNGFMEYIVSAPTNSKNYQENDFKNLESIEKEEFETAFKNYRVHRNKDFDISLLQETTKKSLAVLIKCVKDFVYFNSCILLLEQLLGRKPTDREILYSFQLDSFRENMKEMNNRDNINEDNNNGNDDFNVKTKDSNSQYRRQAANTQYQKDVMSNHHREMSNKLVDIISYSENEIECRIDRFFTPFLEVVIDRFEEKVAKRSYFLRILIGCLKDSLQGIRSRLYKVYPKMIINLRNNFIGQLFKIAYHEVRISAIKQNLPMHLPLSTLRLAKRAFTVYEHMEYLQYDVILKYRNKLVDAKNLTGNDSFTVDDYLEMKEKEKGKDTKEKSIKNKNKEKDNYSKGSNAVISIITKKLPKNAKVRDKDKIDINEELYKEFVSEIIKIEDRFKNRGGNKKTNEFMRKQQQDKLLDDMVARLLKVSVDRVKEAIDAYYSKEVGLRDKIPKHLKMRLSRSNMLYGNTGYYADTTKLDIYDENEDMDLLKELLYIKTLRKLAIEAIDDRLTRLLYMSHNGLFLDVFPEYEELIEHLKIPKKTADFIVFTGTLICREYEVWRIKLNLSPYVNELNINPNIITKLKLDPFNLPYHISTSLYNNLKLNMDIPEFDEYMKLTAIKGPKNCKKESNNRKRLIKPNMSSVNELLMNYKKNYKEYEKILKKSPIEYLKPTGVFDD